MLNFYLEPMRLQRILSPGSVRFFMFSFGLFSRIFKRRIREKINTQDFCEATELRVTMDHEFVENSTSPPFLLCHAPFTWIYHFLFLGKRLARVNWALKWSPKPNFSLYVYANFMYL